MLERLLMLRSRISASIFEESAVASKLVETLSSEKSAPSLGVIIEHASSSSAFLLFLHFGTLANDANLEF